MEITTALKIFATLSQETRLQVFRLLVQAGPDGLSAGDIGNALGILNNTLSFHLNHLSNTEIITSNREGRYIYYVANFTLMRDFISFMVQDCCNKKQVKIQRQKNKNSLVIELSNCRDSKIKE